MTNKYSCWCDNEPYEPVNPPVADTDEIAAIGPRLMLRHGNLARQTETFWATPGILTAGWVIGIRHNES